MDNEISTNIDAIIRAELHASQEITDKTEEATRALEDLHAAIEELYILRKGTREGLKSVDEFIIGLRTKFGAAPIENFGARQAEIVQLLDNISWSIRSVLDAINKFDEDVKKGFDKSN